MLSSPFFSSVPSVVCLVDFSKKVCTDFGEGLWDSGVAGPLAAQGGGQICRPFVLGF